MTNQEIYNQYFSDEEYDLDNAPIDVYSYRSGWNEALKRASIVMKTAVRPKSTTFIKPQSGWEYCSNCNKVLEPQDKFCWNCGAEIVKENKHD